ncbi:alpha/beta fold hydrolase [Nocardia jinanensis]|uniref:Alpha/beta hydrolase n=1 Tax=Nocardia jinanensis TaxID=382504 RepID=A0A917RDF3_9NOCA|nr:alpha/beta fold hydrolase [Nocardia jinanensis]GGL02223.1 alpha/beta hydrolase [Nocardia jinanensis]
MQADTPPGRYTRNRLTSFVNDDLTFDVIDEGPLDGTPIVLLHGFPQTATQWSRLTPFLHESGYRTIAPVQRGYSPGARPRGRFAYRISALVGDTTALITALGDGPVHLVGHDWGSTVAWATAAQRPDLVRTLTSVSVPHPMAFARSLVSSSQAFRTCYMALFQLPWIPEAVISAAFRAAGPAGRPGLRRRAAALSGLDEEQFDRVRRDIVDSGALSYALNWYRAMPIVDRRRAGQKVSAPTTHVSSTRDVFMARRGAELTAEYVTGPFGHEILDATHWIPEERPAELAAIILARTGGAG